MSPGLRAAAELARDPARTDAQIGLAAQCTPRTVLRVRHVLQRRGVIEPVPREQRAGYAYRSRNPGAAARAAAHLALDPSRSNCAIAADACCSDQTVLAARRAQAHTEPVTRVNVMQQKLRAIPDDAHAPRSTTDPLNRAPRRYSEPPDEIEDFCPACTPEYAGGGWIHDRACVFAARQKV